MRTVLLASHLSRSLKEISNTEQQEEQGKGDEHINLVPVRHPSQRSPRNQNQQRAVEEGARGDCCLFSPFALRIRSE